MNNTKQPTVILTPWRIYEYSSSDVSYARTMYGAEVPHKTTSCSPRLSNKSPFLGNPTADANASLILSLIVILAR